MYLTVEQKAYRKSLQREAIQRFQGKVVVNTIPITITSTGIKEFLNQPHSNYFAKNELVRDLVGLLTNATYVCKVPYHKNNYDIVATHLFRIYLQGKPNFLIVRESRSGKICLYSISECVDLPTYQSIHKSIHKGGTI